MPAAPRPTSADMEAWYKVAQPRREVREGRSFNPDEFAIALEQVVAGTGPPPTTLATHAPTSCHILAPFHSVRSVAIAWESMAMAV